jgi:hypothetical protein
MYACLDHFNEVACFNLGGILMAAFFGHAVLVTTSVAADQEIYSYTAPSPLTMKFLSMGAAYTSYNATEAYLGFARLQIDTGGGWETCDRSPAFVNTDLDNNNPLIIRPLGAGQVLATGSKIRGICTPSTSTSIRWTTCVWGDL